MVGAGTTKRKGKVNQVYVTRPYTRHQAKAMVNAFASTPGALSSSSYLSLNNSTLHFRSGKSAKMLEATTQANVRKLGKSINESIPTTGNIHSLQQSDQNSSSPSSGLVGIVRAAIDNLLTSGLSASPSVLYSVSVKEGTLVAANTISSNSSKRVHVGEASCTVDGSHSQSGNLGLTEVVGMSADDDCEEVGSSAIGSDLVSVGEYRVKKAAAPMLERMLEKHGDIAVDCTFKAVASRSLFLENICDLIQTLQAKEFYDVKRADIEDMLVVVEDLAKLKLQVGWLEKRLKAILNLKERLKEYTRLKESKAAQVKFIQESKEALKLYEDEILEYSAKILEYRAKALNTQLKLEAAEAEVKNIEEIFSNSRAEVAVFTNSLIQNLL